MNAREWGIALLCCVLPGNSLQPLTPAQLRTLHRRVLAAGMPESPDGNVKPADLMALGYDEAEAGRIFGLLSRESALERYLDGARARGIYPITRLSPEYPSRLRLQLGLDAPALLFASGDPDLFSREAVGVVGSRELFASGAAFARRVGTLAAKEGFVLASGNAVGADQTGQNACYDAGGSYIAYLADSLAEHPSRDEARQLMVAEGGYDLPFNMIRALRRNHFIHAQGSRVFVAQTDAGHGGTWCGAVDNLRKSWSEVYVHADGSEGARLLCERGAVPVAMEELTSLRRLRPMQMSFL